jgi:hypothetical protein
MNRTALTTHVRDLTGIYSTDVISDTLIYTWLNEAYNEIARERDWDWLELTYNDALPAASGGVHTINLPSGTRRVLSAYLVGSSGYVEELVQVPELDNVERFDLGVKYDVDFAGVVRIAPEQTDLPKTAKIRYSRTSVELATGTDSPVFDGQFHVALAYRAAVKVLAFVADDTPRSDFYMAEYQNLLLGMYELYELDHDNRTFQLGQDGLETRKYFPWFRPA